MVYRRNHIGSGAAAIHLRANRQLHARWWRPYSKRALRFRCRRVAVDLIRISIFGNHVGDGEK